MKPELHHVCFFWKFHFDKALSEAAAAGILINFWYFRAEKI